MRAGLGWKTSRFADFSAGCPRSGKYRANLHVDLSAVIDRTLAVERQRRERFGWQWIMPYDPWTPVPPDLDAHSDMLRHAASYAVANEGTGTRLIQDFLGHADIRHTAHYTDISARRLASVRVR
ncbi:MAG: tyrosine-type recombinase/integrase [Acetobacteraceae bacterium]|nr:tyrosine-type recombinase/integrase [Acetobacteraceae bacterium]